MVRAATVDRNGLKKGAWSPEEDEKLRAYIQRYGSWNWRQLPKFAGLSRCGKSCRLRWMNYLRPGVKHGSFSEEEDRLISQLHKEVGNKWSRIALSLPGRTDNQIKNHWHTHLKKREKQDQTATESTGNPIETSESMSKTNRLGAESSVIDNDPLYFTTILESSAWSASDQETSGNVLSSSGVDDHAFMPDTNCLAEDGVASIGVDVFEESSSEFWTQPFVVDNACDQESYPFSGFSLTEEEGYILMCGASCYEAAEDLILGTMQEFP